jgi:hypothetical protein
LSSLKEPLRSRASRWISVRTFHGKAKSGFLSVGWLRLVLRNRLWSLVVTVMFCEVVRAVLFACGGTPIHPFVISRLPHGSRPDPGGPGTEYSVATVSRTLAVSIKETLDKRGRAIDNFRLAFASTRASSSRGEKGRCKPHCYNLFPRLISCRVLPRPCDSIMRVPGEAESGSAGTQPDEE